VINFVDSWFVGVVEISYLDTNVLLETTPLLKFIRNYIRDPSGVCAISSLVRIFLAFSRLFARTVSLSV